ncbi:MAG: hypothetical protein ACQEQ7_13180 [Thermodesulfobacteriota bacterium]
MKKAAVALVLLSFLVVPFTPIGSQTFPCGQYTVDFENASRAHQ